MPDSPSSPHMAVQKVINETEYLFIVGGAGPTPTVHHPQFQYDQLKNGRVCTNEQLLYNLSTGKHIVSTMNLCLCF